MIVERIESLGRYSCLMDGLQTAVDFLRTADMDALGTGCFAVDGERVICTVVDRVLEAQPELWEAHRRHIDIHAVIRGKEKIGCCLSGGLPGDAEYDGASDSVVTTDLTPDGEITLRAGEALVLFPGEIHQSNRPAGGGSVKKVIIKVLCAQPVERGSARRLGRSAP